jgi:hypothetical protein
MDIIKFLIANGAELTKESLENCLKFAQEIHSVEIERFFQQVIGNFVLFFVFV